MDELPQSLSMSVWLCPSVLFQISMLSNAFGRVSHIFIDSFLALFVLLVLADPLEGPVVGCLSHLVIDLIDCLEGNEVHDQFDKVLLSAHEEHSNHLIAHCAYDLELGDSEGREHVLMVEFVRVLRKELQSFVCRRYIW